jgi:hypothetical protein
MSVTNKAADAYSLFKKVKKIRTYGTLIRESIDENTRSSGLMKLGIRAMLEVAGKALGTSLTSHPYFTYHKAHLEALGMALNASSNLDSAQEALTRAVRSADAAESLTKAVGNYTHRRNALKLAYTFAIGGSLQLLRESGPQAEQQLRDAGQTRQSLRTMTDESMYEWRASFCELYLDSVQLLAMAHVELRTTQAAMQRFDAKMKALKSGGSIGTVFAYKAEQDRQWAEYDRAVNPQAGSVNAVLDPAGYAQGQVDAIAKVSDLLGEACEFAMSDDAYKPELLLLRIR